jgi:hypothetical protein
MKCQTECQGRGFATCEGKMQGGCEFACKAPEGAAFCNGQYVDHGDNAQECFAALAALVNFEASGSASSECSGNKCSAEAEGKASASCASAPLGRGLGSSGLLGAALGLIGVSVARRRARRA